MAQQTLNVGSNANDGTGDTLRSAMTKVNDHVHRTLPVTTNGWRPLAFSGNEISATRTNEDLVFSNLPAQAPYPSQRSGLTTTTLRVQGSNENINLLPKWHRFCGFWSSENSEARQFKFR